MTGQIHFDSRLFRGKIKYAVTHKLLARLHISECTARTKRSPLGDCIMELCKSIAGFITLHSIQGKKKKYPLSALMTVWFHNKFTSEQCVCCEALELPVSSPQLSMAPGKLGLRTGTALDVLIGEIWI